jgi:AAA domain
MRNNKLSVNGFDAYATAHSIPRRPIELIPFADMRPRLGNRALIKGILEQEQISLIVGAKQTGKTFLALDLGLHVAAGLQWFGRRVTEGPIVYVAAEAGRSIVNRVCAWRFAHQYDEDASIPFFAITSTVDLCHSDIGDLERLIDAIKETSSEPCALVVVDTISRALAGGDENSPGDMGALVCSLDRLRDEFHAHVAAVHHFGKESSRGARGHSLLEANLDTVIEVEKNETSKTSIATVTKQRDGATGAAIVFKLRPVELGRDEDGDPITSCVIEPANNPTAIQKRKVSGTAKLGLDQLTNCVIKYVTETPYSDAVPKEAKGVNLDLWYKYLVSAGLVNEDGNPREQFKRIRVTLQESGYIGVWNDFVWINR